MADDTASSPEGNINGSNDLSTPLLHSASSPSTTSTIDADDRYDTLSPQRSVASRTSLASTLASTLFGGGSNEKSVHPEKGATYADDIEGRSLDRENHQSIKKLNAFTLSMIIYFNTAGGPFGFEPSVKAAGNLYAIIAFAFMPIVWAVPEMIMTYELSSIYPCASGSVRWIEEAFGTKWGKIGGYVGWIGGVSNNATFPVLFLNYVLHQFYPHRSHGDELDAFLRWGILVGITLSLAYVNYRGLDIVGKATMLVFTVAIAPVVLMIILGIPKVDPEKWLQTPPADNVEVFDDDSLDQKGWLDLGTLGGIAIRPFVNNVYWNFNNFDQASHFSSSVPRKTLRRGLVISLGLVSMAYLLPIMIATGASDIKQDDWNSGALAVAATQIGGRWLGNWIVVSSGIGLLGSFLAEMSADTMQIMGMADRGQIPSIFSHRSPYETPTYALVLGLVVIMALLPLSFAVVVELSNFSYCLSISLEFVAFFQLRVRNGECSRMRKTCYAVMLIPPLMYNVLVIALASYATYIYGAVTVVFGVLLANASSIWLAINKCTKRSRVRNASSNEGSSKCSDEKEVVHLEGN